MLIDWFTVLAQIINFLILVWFLKRFLYKPVLNAIDDRERLIVNQINEAEKRNAEAEEQKTLYLQKNRELDQHHESLLRSAMEEVGKTKDTLLESVHAEYETLREMRQDALLAEERGLQQEIVLKTQEEVFAITRKVLEEMASSTLEEQMTTVFVRQLRALPSSEMERLIQSFRSSSKPVILRSAYVLPAAQRDEIQSVVNGLFETDISVQYETVPGLIGGVELVTNGYKVAWSLADILDQAGRYAGKLIREKTHPLPQKRGNEDGKPQTAPNN